jgi:beta propeller repeat protein
MNRIVVSAVVVVCAVAVSAFGATLHVPGEYPDIQAAIEEAADGDVVVVAPGVYYETINFAGKNIVVTSTDPNDPAIVAYTIINADQDGSVVTFENGETPAAVLTGFTITGGFGTRNDELGGAQIFWGGGIYCFRASPTITKNVIVGNRGPVMLGDTAATTRVSYGGGIVCVESNAIVTYNTIRNNVAFAGAGVMVYIGQAVIRNNLIYDNSAYIGGGVVLLGGSLLNNTIVGNDCNQGPQDGMAGNVYAGFDLELGDVHILNNIIARAPSGGGLLMEGDWRAGTIAFNNVWGNSPGNYAVPDERTGSIHHDGAYDLTGKDGNISADPLFVQPAFGKDFHLTVDSPCINAGDPAYVPLPGEKDIDGEDRIYAFRIDIGADEYVGYVKPVAFAGLDRHVLAPLQPVTLDGSQSFFHDPAGVRTFHWTQIDGPVVTLDDPNDESPMFTPEAFGEYVFQLVVGDGQYDSAPDQVLVWVAPNRAPVANAGADRAWGVGKRATLDGTDSHDPDPIDRLTCQWAQVEGEPVDLEGADTAAPSFLVQAEGQYVFELVVSDGFEPSEPRRVRCIAVPVAVAAQSINVVPGQGYGPYYPDVSGVRIAYVIETGSAWQIAYKDLTDGKVEVLPTTGVNLRPRIDGDLIAWFGGFSYQEMWSPVCSSVFVRNIAKGAQQTLRSRTDTSSFSHPAVSGDRVVWVEHLNIDRRTPEKWFDMPYDICGADVSNISAPVHFTIATHVGRRDPFRLGNSVSDFDSVVDICGDLVVWEGEGNIHAADISDLQNIRVFTVCDHPTRQYGPAISGRLVVWTDERNDRGDIYGADLSDPENIRIFEVAKGFGVQKQAAIDGPLVAYVDGNVLRLACVTRRYGALAIDLPTRQTGVAPALDGTTLVWLGYAYGNPRGLTLDVAYSLFDGHVQNLRTGRRYDYIQHAITGAGDGDEIVLGEGIHEEKVDFAGKAVTVRSTDPLDAAVVAATVVRSPGSTVKFARGEGPDSVLAGLTLAGGNEAVLCAAASPTITRCTIVGSGRAGVRLVGAANPTLTHSWIIANGAAGIEMAGPAEGRVLRRNEATIRNCIIAANRGQGIHGDRPTIINCTIAENLLEGVDAYMPTVVNSIICFNNLGGAQIKSTRATVAYSNVQGGWPGEGNIDADPLFVSLGQWIEEAVWMPGDYHLKSRGWRWDQGSGSWVSDEVTSPCIDAGDPSSELLLEPLTAPQGGEIINHRIDMGVYGGTAEASLAPANP